MYTMHQGGLRCVYDLNGIMKKADISEHQTVAPDDDMLPEYHFDYRQARPNRFATDIVEVSKIQGGEHGNNHLFASSGIGHAIACQKTANRIPSVS